MKTLHIIKISFFSTIFFIAPFFVTHAYDSKATHPPLSNRSVDLYNFFYPHNALTAQEKQWIAQGSEEEDQPSLREAYHYYDPLFNQGLQGFEPSKQWAHDEGLQALSQPHLGLTPGNVAPRSFTWEDAIAAYQNGDKKRAYVTLGHILHLIQDATVPANTRQDAHSSFLGGALFGGSDPYEDGVAKMNMPNISGMSPIIYPTLDAYFDATATYANTHFLSKDSMGFYARPVPTRMDMQFLYGKDEDGKEYRLTAFNVERELNPTPATNSDSYIFNNPLVLQDYWSRLAPRAIESGAGVIELFQETAAADKPTAQKHLGFFQSFSHTASDEVRGVRQVGSFLLANFMPDFSKPKVTFGVSVAPTLSPPFLQVKPGIKNISFTSASEEQAQTAQQNFAGQMQQPQEQFATAINNLVLAQEKNKNQAQEASQTVQLPLDVPTPDSQTSVDESQNAQANTNTHTGAEANIDAGSPQAPQLAHVERVIDGDTIVLSTGEHLRYVGINAPEVAHDNVSAECYAEEATQRNRDLVENKDVALTDGPDNLDIYGRLLRYVWVGDTNINEELVAEGDARADDYGHPHQYDAQFSEAQLHAQDLQIGLWGACLPKIKKQDTASTKDGNKVAENIPSQSSNNIQVNRSIVINEVRPQTGEFVELYNPTDTATSLDGYYFAYYSHAKTDWGSPSRSQAFPSDAYIPAHGFYLIGFGDAVFSAPKENWHPYASSTLANGGGTVAFFAGNPSDSSPASGGSGQAPAVRIDAFGWGNANLSELAPPSGAPLKSGSFARPTNRDRLDHDNNAFDFQLTTVATPGKGNIVLAAQNDPALQPASSSEPTVTPVTPAHIVISEVLVNGAEFVELYNPTSQSQSLAGHYLAYYSSAKTQWNDAVSHKQFPDSASVPAQGYFLVDVDGGNYPEAGWSPDSFSGLSNSGGTVAVFPFDPNTASTSEAAQSSAIDAVGWGDDAAITLKERKTAQAPEATQSISRDATNNDTNDNSVDFSLTSPTPGAGAALSQQQNDNANPGDNLQNQVQNQDQNQNPSQDQSQSQGQNQTPPPAPPILINEIQTGDSEFIELYNPSGGQVSLSPYYFAYYSAPRTAWNNPYRLQAFSGATNTSIAANGFYLIGLKGYGTTNGNPNADWQPYASAQLSSSGGTVAIFSQDPTCGGQDSCSVAPSDAVGWGSDADIVLKEAHTASAPATGKSISRDVLHADTDNNANDFVEGAISPTNSLGETISLVISGPPLWAMGNSDARHTSQSQNPGPAWASSAQAASQTLATLPGYAFALSPLVIDASGNLYVTTATASTTSIYSYTSQGAERWHYDFGAGDLAESPALSLQSDTVYVVSLGANTVGKSGKIYALQASDGSLVKSVSLGNVWGGGNQHDATSPIVDDQGNVYVCTLRQCFSFDSSLNTRWTITLSWGTILGDTSYAGSFASYVKAPVISHGALEAVFRAPNNTFYLLSLSLSNGALAFSHNLQNAPTTGIIFVNDSPSADANGILYLGYTTAQNYTGVAAFDASQGGAFLGGAIASYSNQVFTQAPSISSGGNIFGASLRDNRIFRFSFTPTPQAQNIFTASNTVSTPLVLDANGTMYVGDNSGTMYVLNNTDANTAQILWQYQFPEKKKIDRIVIGNGTVYAITDDGILHALK